MSNVVSLEARRTSRIPVRVSVYPLTADVADVEIWTPNHTTNVIASRYAAATLMQRLETSADPAADLAGFVEAHGEGA